MAARHLLRFRLRTLLILVAIAAVLTASSRAVVNRYNAEQNALQELSDGRFALRTRSERPWWIPAFLHASVGHVFDRVVFFSVAGGSVDFDRGVALRSRNFNDQHLQLITQFRKLTWLDLSETQISPNSVEVLVRMRSLKALDVSGTRVETDAIREFQRRRPNCLVCDSQPFIHGQLHDDESITLHRDKGPLSDAVRLLMDARRGPEAFGNTPWLHVSLDDEIAAPRRAALR